MCLTLHRLVRQPRHGWDARVWFTSIISPFGRHTRTLCKHNVFASLLTARGRSIVRGWFSCSSRRRITFCSPFILISKRHAEHCSKEKNHSRLKSPRSTHHEQDNFPRWGLELTSLAYHWSSQPSILTWDWVGGWSSLAAVDTLWKYVVCIQTQNDRQELRFIIINRSWCLAGLH